MKRRYKLLRPSEEELKSEAENALLEEQNEEIEEDIEIDDEDIEEEIEIDKETDE